MKRQLGLGLAAFLLTLLALLPVRFVASWLPSNVQCASWQGSVWRGQCTDLQVMIPGAAPLQAERLVWKLRPLSLLRLKLRAWIDVRTALGSGSGEVEVGRGGYMAVEDLSAAAVFDRRLATMVPAGWSGQMQARQLVLRLQGNQLQGLSGELQLHDFHDDRGSSYGAYTLSFAAVESPPFVGILKDAGGPLSVAASLTVTGDRRWQLDGTVAPRGDAAALRRQLELLGAPDGNGRYPLRAEGSFK